jgi:hypothetical protein
MASSRTLFTLTTSRFEIVSVTLSRVGPKSQRDASLPAIHPPSKLRVQCTHLAALYEGQSHRCDVHTFSKKALNLAARNSLSRHGVLNKIILGLY